jgi:hypothetical protein
MQHDIKINRALRSAAIGRFPGSVAAMLGALPRGVIASVSSRVLADLLDAAWALAQESKAAALRDAIDEGAIWDSRRQVMVGLA